MGQPTNWNDPEEIITAELEPEEELLWAGRPRLGLVVRATEIIPFGIILLIFGPSLVGLLQGVMNNRVGPAPFQLLFFGAPHLVFMTAYLFGRPIYDAWSRARCAYGVTSERVLFVSGLFGRRVRSLELDSMIDAKFAPSWRGSGGIIRFGSNAASSDSPFRQRTGFAQAAMEYFELDRDAPAVYRLVDGALQRQNRRRRKKGVMTAKASVDQPTVWENANELIEPELAPGEVLLWAGRPRQGFSLGWSQIIFTVLAFLWMQAFTMLGGGAAGFGVFFLWFLLVMKALSVAVHVGRSVYDARLRARTAYAVTTNRLLAVTAGNGGQVKWLALNEVAVLMMMERDENRGSVFVGPDLPVTDAQQRAALRSGTLPGTLRFELSQDARLLYRLIRRARRPVEAAS